MNKNTFFLLFSLVVLIISDWVNSNLIYIFPTGTRHLLLFFTFYIPFIFSNNKIKNHFNVSYLAFFFLFVILLISFNPNAPLLSSILSFFSLFLFFFIFNLGINTNISFQSIEQFFRIFIFILLLFSIEPIILSAAKGEILRYEFGFFREVGALGSFMNIGTIMCLTLYILNNKKAHLYIAILFSTIVLYTVLKKVIISNIFVWLFFILKYTNITSLKKYTYISFLFIFIIALSFTSFISDNIEENATYLENVGADGHVRIAMYLTSYKIASLNFPFGSGLASFGSLGSIFGYYSPLYYEYGINTVGANSESDVLNAHHTLLDTFWPHIIAELGFIGSILYLYLYLYPIIAINKFKNQNLKNYKPIFFLITSLILCSIWEGFTLYTPEIPIFIFVNFGITALSISALSKTRILK